MSAIVSRAKRFFAGEDIRPIDRVRFAYHFQGAPLDTLIEALAPYQNNDGGFGHNLEVDIHAPQSSAFATELALALCVQAGVPGDHPLLQRVVTYLEQSQNDDGCWSFAPEIYEYPLAPWFKGWQFPDLNPACTTAGLLRQLGLGSAALLSRVEALFQSLANPLDLLKDGFYDVRPYAYYFAAEWDHPQRDLYNWGLTWWLIRQHANDSLDGDHFFAYAPTPQSPVAHNLPAAILSERLDRLAAEQQEDGGWPTPYDTHWRGWTTVQCLLVLQAYGRI